MPQIFMWAIDTEANRDIPGVAGRLHFATDTGRVFRDNGSVWETTQMAWQGAYSAGTTYQKFDVLINGGSTFMALATVTGVTPVDGANYKILAAKGDAGAQGPAGATTSLTASFTQPAVSANVTATVGSTTMMGADQAYYVENGGYYKVFSITDSTHVVLTNLGYTGNASPGATVASSSKVTPGGLQGPAGTSAASAVTYAGSTNLSSTNVEAALDELDAEKASTTHATTHNPGGSDVIQRFETIHFSFKGTLPTAPVTTTGTLRVPIPSGITGTIVAVTGTINTLPVGAGSSQTLDIRRSGTSVYTSAAKISFTPGGSQFISGATPDTTSLTGGTHYLTVDLVSAGGFSSGGADIVLAIRYRY